MKKVILLSVLFISAKCFAQTHYSYHYKSPVQFNDGLQTASLSDVKIDSNKIIELTDSIESGYYPNIHSLLIVRNNKLVYENYWPGKDEIWGNDIGIADHGMNSLHDVRSISKSIVSACVGIAIAQGKIKSVDEKIFDFFPEYASLNKGEKSNITIKHLLTMSSGLEWNENVPYTDKANSEIKMDNSADPIQFVLNQPVAVKPGTVWNYNGGGTEVLAAIIKKVTGEYVDQFAKKNLFEPLGIKIFFWTRFPGNEKHPGMPAAASGLRLRSRDLLKFGLLYLRNGKWDSKQIISPDWIKASFASQVQRGKPNLTYGFHFWIQEDTLKGNPLTVVGAVGNGDQRIYFDKVHDAAIVITAGNYNKWDIEHNSWELLWYYILPALITGNEN